MAFITVTKNRTQISQDIYINAAWGLFQLELYDAQGANALVSLMLFWKVLGLNVYSEERSGFHLNLGFKLLWFEITLKWSFWNAL